MKLTRHKTTLQLIAAAILLVIGCGLLIAGLVIPPPGEIHNSVLIAYGETLTFVGALFGIDYHYKYAKSEQSDSAKTSTTKSDIPNENN